MNETWLAVAAAATALQDSGMLYPIPIKLLNKPDTYAGMGDLPVSEGSCAAD
jgi:hypothetical protein